MNSRLGLVSCAAVALALVLSGCGGGGGGMMSMSSGSGGGESDSLQPNTAWASVGPAAVANADQMSTVSPGSALGADFLEFGSWSNVVSSNDPNAFGAFVDIRNEAPLSAVHALGGSATFRGQHRSYAGNRGGAPTEVNGAAAIRATFTPGFMGFDIGLTNERGGHFLTASVVSLNIAPTFDIRVQQGQLPQDGSVLFIRGSDSRSPIVVGRAQGAFAGSDASEFGMVYEFPHGGTETRGSIGAVLQ